MEKWEWDSFQEVNQIRNTKGLKSLDWCCRLENNIRGNCAGREFVKISKSGDIVVEINCNHWTPPNRIADKLSKKEEVLDTRYRSATLIIENDDEKSYIKMGLSDCNFVSWDELCGSYKEIVHLTSQKYYSIECPYCHSSLNIERGATRVQCPICRMIIGYDAAGGGWGVSINQ
jgi:LSD1 subclass zinc finger protein